MSSLASPYVATLSARFRMLLQYRSAALAGIITQFFFGIVRVMIFDAFYRMSPNGQPLSAMQTTTYLWLGQAFLLIPMMGADAEVGGLIRSGNIAYELMRPVDLYSYWLSRMVATRAAPTVMRALPLLVVVALLGQLLAPASAVHLVLSVVAISLGLVLASALFAVVTISLLWTISGEGISRLVPPVVFFLSGMIIPLPLFPDWMQPILRVLPFRGLIDVPFRIYLGDFSVAGSLMAIGQQLCWIVFFVVVGRLVLRAGLRRLIVQGGLPMLNSLNLYFAYIAISIRGQMQYRVNFVLQALAQFLITGAEFLGLAALFSRFKSVAGWSLREVAVFYGTIALAFAISEMVARGFDSFARMINAGDFDRILLRPRTAALQILGQELQLMRVGRFTQGLLVLVWGAMGLRIEWTAAKVELLIAAILGGACLFIGLIVLQATMCFWTVESLEIFNVTTFGGVEAAQFPITIYRPWFRHFFTFVVPLATINYFPLHVILGRVEPLGTPVWFCWASPLVGVLFLAVCLQVWRVGVRHYASTGS